MENTKWKKVEELVAKIQVDLSPDSVVTHNDKITGKRTGVPRQIDVSIRRAVGQFDLLIVLDCKDHARPLDVKDIEEFMGLAQDVGAHKAAMVAVKGFSDTAKKRAQDAGIEIYRLIDTGDHDWKTIIELPAVIEFTGITKFSLSLSAIGDTEVERPDVEDILALAIFDEEGHSLGTVRELIRQKWNARAIPEEPGEYKGVEFAPNPVKFKSGGRFFRAKITANVFVEKRLHFGYWPISKVSGFLDDATGAIITRNVEFGNLSMVDVEKNWPRINSIDELAVRPVITLRALDHWSPDDLF